MNHRRMYEGDTRYAINGDELLSSEAWEQSHGHAIALDRNGYEYMRGLDERLVRDVIGGGATLERLIDGRRERWTREDGQWTRDDSDGVRAPKHAGATLDTTPDRAEYRAWWREFQQDWRLHGNVWLHGNAGTGKTFAADTALRFLASKGVPTERLKWHEFAMALHDTHGNDDLDARRKWVELRERVAAVPVLVLDDFGAGKPTPSLQDAVLTLIDRRIEAGLRTLITSNLALGQLAVQGWDSRTRSRLALFRAVSMGQKDWRASRLT